MAAVINMKKMKKTEIHITKTNLIRFLPIFIFSVIISFRDAGAPQRSIDGGLFVSGEINYSTNLIMSESFNNSFTLLHYLTAFFIKINLDLFSISFIIQFINIFVLSIAIYLLNLYVNNHLLLNYLSIFTILNSLPIFLKDLTLNYPLLINSVHSYGQYGISFSLLIISLYLWKKINTLAFVFPFFVSIHSGWALSTLFILLIFFLINKSKLEIKFQTLKILFFSIFMQIPFWLHAFVINNQKISINNSLSINELYLIYVKNWDFHRSFGWDNQNIMIHLIILILLFFLYLILNKSNLKLKNIVFITGINSLLGIFLTFLDLKIFNKSFILLNTFMPGKIINLSLILYVIIIFSFVNFILITIGNFNLSKSKLNLSIFHALYFLVIFSGFYFNFEKFDYLRIWPFPSKYNYSTEKDLCDILNSSDSLILTIGNASRIIPLNCRSPILLDTTQIDFIPYSKNSLPTLKDIIEDVYGLHFNFRKNISKFVAIDSIPSGGIDQILVEPIWENRNAETWQVLACEYKFKYIVVPKDINLKLNLIKIGDFFQIYETNQNCNSESNKFVGNYSIGLPREFLEDGSDFYWIPDLGTDFYIKNLNKSKNKLQIKFELLPNPCKNSYELKIFNQNAKYLLDVGSDKLLVNLEFTTTSKDFTPISFQVQSEIKPCKIEGEVRNLVTLIRNIELSYTI